MDEKMLREAIMRMILLATKSQLKSIYTFILHRIRTP